MVMHAFDAKNMSLMTSVGNNWEKKKWIDEKRIQNACFLSCNLQDYFQVTKKVIETKMNSY